MEREAAFEEGHFSRQAQLFPVAGSHAGPDTVDTASRGTGPIAASSKTGEWSSRPATTRQGRSRTRAAAVAPAPHTLTNPYRASRRAISYASCPTIRAPVAAKG